MSSRDFWDRIHTIAEHTREWALVESRRLDPRRPENLQGYCAVASAELWRRLKKAEIDARICMATPYWSHVYVVVEDHVVDITATQFGRFPPVYIRHVKELEGEQYYRQDQIFNTASELRGYIIQGKWPLTQIPQA